MRLGERLRAARLARSMSLTDVARAARLSKGFISQVESGLSNPSLASLHKLTASLGLPPGALFDEAYQDSAPASSRLGPLVQGLLAAESSELKVFSLNSNGGNGIVPVASGGIAGTVALLSLRAGAVLYGPEPLPAVAGIGSCAVLKGAVRMTQGGSTVTAREGEVVTFEPGRMYVLACGAGGAAAVFLSLPGDCQLPVRSDVNLAMPHVNAYPRTGPFRLVEMRALRGAARSRGD